MSAVMVVSPVKVGDKVKFIKDSCPFVNTKEYVYSIIDSSDGQMFSYIDLEKEYTVESIDLDYIFNHHIFDYDYIYQTVRLKEIPEKFFATLDFNIEKVVITHKQWEFIKKHFKRKIDN